MRPNNITKGTDATHFVPHANITRQQMITMVVRAAENLAPAPWRRCPPAGTTVLSYADPTHGANIKKAEYNGLLEGIRASAAPGLAGWNTGANATRGEVAQILWNLLEPATPSGSGSTSMIAVTIRPSRRPWPTSIPDHHPSGTGRLRADHESSSTSPSISWEAESKDRPTTRSHGQAGL